MRCDSTIRILPLQGASTDLLIYSQTNDPVQHICHVAVLLLHGRYFIIQDLKVIEPYIPPLDISFATVTDPEIGKYHGSFLAAAPYYYFLCSILENYILVA